MAAALPAATHLQVPGAAAAASSSSPPVRPKFNSHLTSDRLREGAGLYLPPPFRTGRTNIRKGRTSVFKELGLDDPCAPPSPVILLDHRHALASVAASAAAASPQPCPRVSV